MISDSENLCHLPEVTQLVNARAQIHFRLCCPPLLWLLEKRGGLTGSVSNDRTLLQGKGPSRGDRRSSKTKASPQGNPRAILSMASTPARAPIHTCCPAREEGAAHSVKGKRYVKVGALPSVTD